MRVLYFDCNSGISGDMILGTLLDLGIDNSVFKNELDKLNVSGYKIHIEKIIKNGISVNNVTIEVTKDNDEIRDLAAIEQLIELSELKDSVKSFSKKVFREIASAEAKVHNSNINEIHFHEIGAIDSIVDVIGSAICIELLGIKKVISSPLHDGMGFVECQHGIIPVPVPAVLEMLSGSKIPIITENINTELITPTGMAIIKHLASSFGEMPMMTIERVGYGAGKKEIGRLNALRSIIGESFENDYLSEEVSMIETNIDNMNPEILGYVLDKLMDNGAYDAFFTPVYMKKNRPAIVLSVITEIFNEKRIIDIIFKETSSIGIRKSRKKRNVMLRETKNLSTQFGDVKVKIASGDNFQKVYPEFEECKKLSNKTGIPLREIYEIVNRSQI